MDDETPIIHTEQMRPRPSASRNPMLGPDQIAQLQKLADEKYTQIEIAQKIGASVGTVSRYCKRFGLNVRLGAASPEVRPAIMPTPANGNGQGITPPEAAAAMAPAPEAPKRRRGRPPKHQPVPYTSDDPRQMPLPETGHPLVGLSPTQTGTVTLPLPAMKPQPEHSAFELLGMVTYEAMRLRITPDEYVRRIKAMAEAWDRITEQAVLDGGG